MPQRPIQRLVSGPAIAWPMLVAASTRPAAAYEWCTCSTCSRNASDSMPNGNRAVSWAAMITTHAGGLQEGRVGAHESESTDAAAIAVCPVPGQRSRHAVAPNLGTTSVASVGGGE